MPGHNLKALEADLKVISDSSDELSKLIYRKGYTTPREFALVSAAAKAMAGQMKALVKVSEQIIRAAEG
jgi:hypothetical protein